MRRQPEALTDREHDLVVVGGGIFGAAAAREAAHRGLAVALVERDDFSAATSANHLKVIHGGIRYLQHGDLARVRESSRECSALLRIAPHLTRTVPVVVPTYGRGRGGRALMRAGLMAWGACTLGRNRGIGDDARRLPGGRMLSPAETLELFPHLPREGLTGAGCFWDGQMRNPPRLALAFLKSAVEDGAAVANYVECRELLLDGERLRGVVARDRLSGERLEVRGRAVLNAAGPWAHRLVARLGRRPARHPPTFSRDLALVLRGELHPRYGLACRIGSRDSDSLFDRGGRHLFFLPWRGRTLAGVWHRIHHGPPDGLRVGEEELRRFVDEANTACPGLGARVGDIAMIHTGLVLFGGEEAQRGGLSFGKRSTLVDHGGEGLEGLFTLIGVRATMARRMAELAVTRVIDRLGLPPRPSRSAALPLHGGDLADLEALAAATDLPRELLYNHGSDYRRVLEHGRREPLLGGALPGSSVLQAEVVHAVREEMAVRLEDVVFRRTALGSGGEAPAPAVAECGELMGGELGWDAERVAAEVAEVGGLLASRGPWIREPRNDLPKGARDDR